MKFLKLNEMKTLNDRVKRQNRNGPDSACKREKGLSMTS